MTSLRHNGGFWGAAVTVLLSSLVARASELVYADEHPPIARMLQGTAFPEAWRGPHALVVSYNENSATFCSGTLVGKRTILTAAHCLREESFLDIVVAGQSWSGAAVYRNPKFDIANLSPRPDQIREDLGIITLEGEVSTVAPLPLVTNYAPRGGQQLEIVGFGFSADEITNPQLLYTHAARGLTHIGTTYNGYFSNRVTSLQPGSRSSFASVCRGDSGGSATSAVGRIRYVVGTVSVGSNEVDGTTCILNTASGGQGLFTDVNAASAQNFLGQFDDIEWISGTDLKILETLQLAISSLRAASRSSLSARHVKTLKSVRGMLGAIKIARHNPLHTSLTRLRSQLRTISTTIRSSGSRRAVSVIHAECKKISRQLKIRTGTKRAELF